jgi:hypothetical protein
MRGIPVALATLVALAGAASVATAAPDMGHAEDVLDKPKCRPGSKRNFTRCKDQQTYVHTNEGYLHVFRPYIEPLGGAYVGIGSDQGLTLAAWARSELAWLMDYDPPVVWMNRIERAFLLEADSPKAFVALWKRDRASVARARALLERAYAGDPDLTDILDTYDDYRRKMLGYFQSVLRGARHGRRHHFLHDPADYAWVRTMYQEGRIRIVKGDLLKDQALRGIADAARALKVPVRVLYLSCAEQYWDYSQTFRDNMTGLPVDDQAVVLRLLYSTRWGERKLGSFHYIVQSTTDFQQRLLDPEHKRVSRMMRHRKEVHHGLFTIGLTGRLAGHSPGKRKP